MSATEALEAKLKVKLTEKLAPREGVSGSALEIILPLLIDLFARLMDRCNATPEKAARNLKRFGTWTRLSLTRGVRSVEGLNAVRTECCESIEEVVADTSESDLLQMMQEQDEEFIDLDNSPF